MGRKEVLREVVYIFIHILIYQLYLLQIYQPPPGSEGGYIDDVKNGVRLVKKRTLQDLSYQALRQKLIAKEMILDKEEEGDAAGDACNFKCEKCKMNFSTGQALVDHNVANEDVHRKVYCCRYCPKKIFGTRNFIDHLALHKIEQANHSCKGKA